MGQTVKTTPTARELIQVEVDRQRAMWGVDRDDSTNGELYHAALAQLDSLYNREDDERNELTHHDYFDQDNSAYFPSNWSGFRDYGSGIANLVVAAAYLETEISRRLRKGESFQRKDRDPVAQPYDDKDTPKNV